MEPLAEDHAAKASAALESDNAALLARRHRLGLQEATMVLNAFKRTKKNQDGGIDLGEFRALLCTIFDVPDVAPDILRLAYHEVSCQRDIDIDRFMSWYVRNMFTQVNHLNASPKDTEGNSLTYNLAGKLGVSVRRIDAIKAKFDRLKTSKAGELEFDEFVSLLHILLRVKREDLGEPRLRKFWREVPTSTKGTVDFGGFTEWYIKNFPDEDNPTPSGSLSFGRRATETPESTYSSLSAFYQRGTHLDRQEPKLRLHGE